MGAPDARWIAQDIRRGIVTKILVKKSFVREADAPPSQSRELPTTTAIIASGVQSEGVPGRWKSR